MATRGQRKLDDFGDLFMPEQAEEPILGAGVRAALMEWLTEIWAEKELAAVGIKARRRAIFYGPPGCGKTTLAHHLAARLGLPMLAVRPDCIISKYMGVTGENIGALFEAAKAQLGGAPIVLFIDEFDTLASSRRQAGQAADNDRNESVGTLLQRLEQHQGFLIAATNHSDWIDQAIWRRFDMHIEVEMPGQDERERIIARYLAPFGQPQACLTALGKSCSGASPALLRALCENLKRQLVIGPKLASNMAREAVLSRILASVHPHPDLPRPELWSLGISAAGAKALLWPLPNADHLPAIEAAIAADDSGEGDNVIPMGERRP